MMALYRQAVIEHILGINLYTANWYLGLYKDATDPYVDLVEAEVISSRAPIDGLFEWDGTDMTNFQPVVTGEVGEDCLAAGWFMINDSATEVFWSGAFVTGIDLLTGMTVGFPIGTINLDLQTP